MKEFKFFSKKVINYRSIGVEYTTEHNGKSYTRLKFAERDQTDDNPNIEIYHGTFLRFKRMIENHPVMDWYHRKPIIHLIAFYSDRFHNCQRLGYIEYFSYGLTRFGKNQKLKIMYEIV